MRLIICTWLLVGLALGTSCGLLGDPDTVSLDEALAPVSTSAPTPEPQPTVVSEPAASPEAAAEPTALPTATPLPTPAWQVMRASDGLSMEVPSSWTVVDDQAAIDAIMTNDDTTAALNDLGVAPLLPLFDVRIRALIDGPDGEKVIYVTIDRSPFLSIQTLEALGDGIASQADATVTERAFVDTELGPALRAATDLGGTTYVEWFWIDNGAAQMLIFRSDSTAERHALETIGRS